MHDDSAAASGAQNDPEHDAEADAGTVGGFAQGEAVGVVLDPHLAVEGLADVVVEAVAVQGDGIGTLDQAGGGADHAGDADPDRRGDAQVGFRLAHQSGDGIHRVGVGRGVEIRCRSTSEPSGPRTAISILVPPRSMPIRW